MLMAVMLQFYIEKSFRAMLRILQIALLFSVLVLLFYALHLSLNIILYPLFAVLFSALIIFIVPYKFPNVELEISEKRLDERTTIFSRMFELKGESEKKSKFYKAYPELKLIDENLRTLPGLLSKESLFYDPLYFGRAESYNSQLSNLFSEITGKANPQKTNLSNIEIERKLKQIAKQLGAVDIGFTKLNDYHFYSVKGRGSRYGEIINSAHKYAVAISVEMDIKAVSFAPKAPVIAESTKQYLQSAKIAIGIAGYLRECGYDATAHIDGNYEVICPLVARDAGLGDIGRMGILMTPKQGPRVRLAVVTTNFELKSSVINANNSLQYFCKICKKCAKACPSQAIQHGNIIHQGKVRYKINHEKCYGYWAKVGTDCARCMSVCPYAHPGNWLHNIVRFGIRNNPLFARIALRADNFFYGKN